MDAQQAAQDLYDAQSVTVDEYPSVEAYVNALIELAVEAYVNALIELADENGWYKSVDRDELREHLIHLAS